MPHSRRKTRRFTFQYLYANWACETDDHKDALMKQFEKEKDFLDEAYFKEATTYITENIPTLLGIIQHF